jgi:tetratricopeptide (TPR) repeat protein
MPAEAQKIKRANEAISRASELMKDARYEEADKIIDSLLTINPNYSDALYLRSCLLMEDDSYADGEGGLRRIPFKETRQFVKKVTDAWDMYERLYGKEYAADTVS